VTAVGEINEIVQTVDRLEGALEDLTVRGLRSAGPEQLALLGALHEEFERIGAGHLAGRIGALLDALRTGDRDAAAALLRAQTSLRVFERILTLGSVADVLRGVVEGAEEPS